MDALNTPQHTNNHYPFAVVSSISEPRSGVPARRFLTPDEGVDLRIGGVVGDDDLETVSSHVKDDKLGSMSDQDAIYYESLDDDYSDDRYKRHVLPYKRPAVATSAASRVSQATGSQTWGSSRLQNELKQAEELQEEEEQQEEQQEGARDHVHQRALASQPSWWRR